jgi:hypothetical protein
MLDSRGRERTMPDLGRWSVTFGGASASREDGEVVLLAPPGTPLAEAFAELRAALDGTTTKVRLVVHGAIVRANRPAWLTTQRAVLTELDAYLPSERTSMLREAEEAFGRWLAETFRDAFSDGLPPERVLWGSAMWRVFAVWFAALPLAHGLASQHGTDAIRCLDARWPGAFVLESLVRASGGRFEIAARPRPRFWAPKIIAQSAINLAGAFAVRTREYLRERPARARVNQIRRRDADPDVWVGIHGAWPRTCRHVIEGVGGAALSEGRSVGVLLQSSLQLGSVQEDAPSTIFPALDQPPLDRVVAAVDQCASLEHASDLVREMLATTRAAARSAVRLARGGPHVKLGPLEIDLSRDTVALARLATFEVLRAREAAAATRSLLRRREFRGKKIVWPHASKANIVAPDLMLQAAGATTFDLVHGALAAPIDFITHARTYSTTTIWWTESELRYVAPYLPGHRGVGGYVPRSLVRRERQSPPDAPLHILVLSNYATPTDGVFKDECYQDALLEAVSASTRAVAGPYVVRWRPHPYDDRGRVDASRENWKGSVPLELSTSPDALQSELAWADVVISSESSSIVEALLHEVGLFIHDIPLHERDVIMKIFPSERCFGNADELGPQLHEFIDAHRRADGTRFAPEERLREAFFGPTRAPRDLSELLFRG